LGYSKEDWYLTSGDMCQRNSCRLVEKHLWEGLSKFRGEGSDITTAPLCQRILVWSWGIKMFIVWGKEGTPRCGAWTSGGSIGGRGGSTGLGDWATRILGEASWVLCVGLEG
jgi:hypothetical protein